MAETKVVADRIDLSVASGDTELKLNVGIGIASPDGSLHVHTASAGSVTAHTNADDLVLENSGNGGLSILTPNNAAGIIYWGDPEDNNVAEISYDHATDEMLFRVNAAIAMTINSSQQIGVGIATPDGTFHVHTASAGSVTANADANDFVIEDTTDVGMSFLSSNTGVVRIVFGDPDDNDIGRIVYAHASDEMEFNAGGAVSLVITAAQARFPDGSGASPSISFVNDTDTGLYRATADDISIVAGGVVKVRFDESGHARFSQHIVPTADNSLTLGDATFHWSEVFAINGAINTSHSTTKYDIEPMADLEVPTAVQFKRKNDAGTYREGRDYLGYINDNLPNVARSIDKDGTVDSTGNYENAVVGILCNAVRKLQAELKILKGE